MTSENTNKTYLLLKSLLVLLMGLLITICFIFFIGVSRVDAKIIREGSVSNASNTKLYTAYNLTQMTYSGQWSYISLYYDISGSSGQNILFSTNYQVVTNSTNVGRISMSIWYIGTDGSWNQIIDNCQRSGTRTDGDTSSSWDLQIVCNIPTTKNFSEIAVSINLLNRNGQNMNSPYLRFIQKSNNISTSGTSNQAIGDMIINNDDKNTSIIINNNDANTEKITASIDGVNEAITNSNVSSDVGTSFFNGFNDTDHGGLSGIVTAPLNSINAMLSNTCSPITGTVYNKSFEIPCGTEMWSRLGVLKDFLNLTLGELALGEVVGCELVSIEVEEFVHRNLHTVASLVQQLHITYVCTQGMILRHDIRLVHVGNRLGPDTHRIARLAVWVVLLGAAAIPGDLVKLICHRCGEADARENLWQLALRAQLVVNLDRSVVVEAVGVVDGETCQLNALNVQVERSV